MSASIISWGDNNYGQATVPVGLSDVTAISAGGQHTVILKRNGTVVAWGGNGAGQATVPEGLSDVIAISAGDSHTVILKRNGTVVAWGYNDVGQSTVPQGLSDVIAISAARGYHTVILKRNGTVVAWGYNQYGQTTVPQGLSDVIAVSAGGFHTVALKRNGTVVAWGYNEYGQTTVPQGLSDVIAVSAGDSHTVALKSDGTVVAWGYNATVPQGLSDVIAISAGGYHTVALKTNGTVVTWGYNNAGQLNVPQELSGVTAVSAGGFHTLASKNIIDTSAPTPNLTSIMNGSISVSSGSTTNATSLVLSGTNESGSSISVYNGSTLLGSATVLETNWNYTTSSLTHETIYNFNIKETDASSNTSVATSNWIITIDQNAPTIVITRGKTTTLLYDPNNINNKDIITFTLSEASTNFIIDDITYSAGSLSNFTGSGILYTALFTATSNSTTSGTINVAANTFTDSAGNNNLSSNTLTIPINTIPFANFSLSPTLINERELYSGTFTSDSPTQPQYTILSQPIDNLYISGNTLIAKYPFNYREYQNYPVQIRATSNGINIILSFTIQILNLPDAPISVNISNNNIPANSPISTVVGTLTTYDNDPNDTFIYQFSSGVGGTDNSYFTIVGNKLYTSQVFNYNTKNTYTIRVKTTDSNGLSVENPIILNVVLPIANSFEISGLVGRSCSIILQGQNIAGGNLIYEIVQQPKYGSLTMVNQTGNYIPNINIQDSFQYIVKEGSMTSLPGTVIISNYNQTDIQNIPRSLGTFDFDNISFDGTTWRFGTITTDTFIQGSSYYTLGNYTLTK